MQKERLHSSEKSLEHRDDRMPHKAPGNHENPITCMRTAAARIGFRTPQARFTKGEQDVPLRTHTLPCKTYVGGELIGFGIHNSFGVVRIQP